MKLNKTYRLDEIAALVACEYEGDPAHQVLGINEIHLVESGDIVFVDHPKYYDKALNSAATTIIIDKKVSCPIGKALIISANPFDDFNKLTKHFAPKLGPKNNESGTQTKYPNVYIGHHVTIGNNVQLYPGACLMDGTIIHDNEQKRNQAPHGASLQGCHRSHRSGSYRAGGPSGQSQRGR